MTRDRGNKGNNITPGWGGYLALDRPDSVANAIYQGIGRAFKDAHLVYMKICGFDELSGVEQSLGDGSFERQLKENGRNHKY